MKLELLEKIEALFWKNSFAELSMDDVGKELDMKKASLYYHFSSKEDMFLKVLDSSFDKYVLFLNKAFLSDDIDIFLSEIINYPCKNKNLFAVISQKGYCNNIKNNVYISSKNQEIEEIYFANLSKKFNFSKERTMIFKSVVDEFGKKICNFECKDEAGSKKMINEIKSIFLK